MSLYFETVENNKNKKSVKFQGDMLNYCDFIQVFVFTSYHHLKLKNVFQTQIILYLPIVFFLVYLTHSYLETRKRAIGKQCIP